ncbi:SdpI family protein [Prescottella agglutinans]|uniref:Membrane protein n=1 Tax=Prescottella agglutinans TaxID=1644129 RepID=A0ABT6MKF0_9NOCA|nr:SdpI family protein [Prescottella agglutinans]MDH6284695.1 putative membrane protein [Prescottella agglutinans]
MAGTSDLLELTITMMSTTLTAAGVAGLMPHLIGDEPNPVVGIRTKATLSSDEAWQLAHRVAQPILRRIVWTAVAGLCIQIIIGVVTGFGSVVSSVAAVVACATAFIVLIYAGFKGNAAAKALERCPGDSSGF